MTDLTPDTPLEVPTDVVSRELEGETVLLHLDTAVYFGLNGTGTRLWQLIAEHGRLGPACDVMAAEFEANRAEIERDALALARDLVTNGLLLIRG